jgi:hypothetical protein
MRIRTSVQVALIVGACTVLAPLYGPSIRARAATPQDDLDKSFKSIASALWFQLLIGPTEALCR